MKRLGNLAAVLESPIGKLGIEVENNCLVGIYFLAQETKTVAPSSFAAEVAEQLNAYFEKTLLSFNLPLNLTTTPFHQTVLKSLCDIQFGKTMTYGELAKQLNTGPRAIGNACRRNPIPIIIPCHRLLAQNHIGGYSGAVAGELLNIKKWLLNHEK